MSGHKLFCEDCIEEGVSVLGGQDVNVKTGKPVKKPKDKNKFWPKENEVWIEVKSPYKKYKEGN